MRGWQEVILALPAHNPERRARTFSISCVAGCAQDNCRRQHAVLSTGTKSNVAVFLQANQREAHRILYEPSRVDGVSMRAAPACIRCRNGRSQPNKCAGSEGWGCTVFQLTHRAPKVAWLTALTSAPILEEPRARLATEYGYRFPVGQAVDAPIKAFAVKL
jgi:hypothetical protein